MEMIYNSSMKKSCFFLVPVILAIAALFISCTDFFSKSWASWAARDPDKLIPTVTAGNVDELLEMAENNPDLSLAILKRIQDAVGKSSGADTQKLQEAALEAAVNAAGLGQAVLGAADKLTSIETDTEARDLVLDALYSMKNLEAANELLEKTLPEPYDEHGNLTEAFLSFSEKANVNDLAMAAALLIAGESKKAASDPNAYINELGDRIDHGNSLSSRESLALEMALAALDRADELSGPLKEVLDGLNLKQFPVIPVP